MSIFPKIRTVYRWNISHFMCDVYTIHNGGYGGQQSEFICLYLEKKTKENYISITETLLKLLFDPIFCIPT